MKAVRSSETSEVSSSKIQAYRPEDCTLHDLAWKVQIWQLFNVYAVTFTYIRRSCAVGYRIQ
jgi:hypothetical protein